MEDKGKEFTEITDLKVMSKELSKALKTELDRRENAIKNGDAKLFTWTEVKANIQQLKSRLNEISHSSKSPISPKTSPTH